MEQNWDPSAEDFLRYKYRYSNMIRVNTDVYWEMALYNRTEYSSILPLQFVKRSAYGDYREANYKDYSF